jgi:hypothetical protein
MIDAWAILSQNDQGGAGFQWIRHTFFDKALGGSVGKAGQVPKNEFAFTLTQPLGGSGGQFREGLADHRDVRLKLFFLLK